MKTTFLPLALAGVLLLALPNRCHGQSVDEGQVGAWYMFFYNARFGDSPFGVQGDAQHRNWDVLGDLEQLLLRSGATWRPGNGKSMLTLGYASITSGRFGPSDAAQHENRIYQEALIPQRFRRVALRHRMRLEQRWVEGQDFRARVRYALFADVPLNRREITPGTFYLAFYNELFLNIGNDVGGGRSVDTFDRNRVYGALGYAIGDRLRVQGGYMLQTTDEVDKQQLQFSVHKVFR